MTEKITVPRTAAHHDAPPTSDAIALATLALANTALGRMAPDIAIATSRDLAGVSGHLILIEPDWIEHVWRWGLASIEGRLTVATIAAGPDGRPGRVRTVTGQPDAWTVRDQQLHIGSGLRWRLAVF